MNDSVFSSEEQRQSRLLDAMAAIAWSASAKTFRFTYVSPAAEKLLGYPTSRWIDEPAFWSEHLHPEDLHIPMLCHNETVAGRDHELVYRLIAADGRTVWFRDYVNVHMVDGVAVELFGVMVDITREREAEAASSENRENFRRMVELSPDCIGVQVDQTYVYVNLAFVDLLGAKNETEILGKSVFKFLHDDSHAAFRERLQQVDAGKSVPYIPVKYRRTDGSLIHVEVAALPLRYGSRDAVQVIARDVSEKVLARQALEASEQRYRELVDDISEILYTVDLDGRFVSLSRSFERSTGYRIEEWIGRPFTELFMPHSVPEAVDHFAQVLQGKAGIIRQYDLAARTGAVVSMEISWQPRYLDGVVAGTIGMARDVTEHRNINRKLEEARRLSSLGQLAASLAHEFNNVLMGIQPFIEVIGRQVGSSSAVTSALGHITRAVVRGKRASQEVLRFANPKEPQLSPIDIHSWLPNLLAQTAAAIPSTIALSSSIDPDVRFIRADREHLDQVITNLVFNARDAIGGPGTIQVDVSSACSPGISSGEAQFVQISVTDNGPGIAPAIIDRIFEPLFTTKRNGTGLGLAIARRLIEAHGGMLSAESLPEGGSAFHLLVPAAEAPAVSTQPLVWKTPGVTRILLIEDDLSVGTGLEELLNAEGYEATWVRTAGDACEAARRIRPHVAIIDVNLPDGNGVDLIPLLRAEHADLPIVFSTGHVELNLADEKRRIVSLMKPYEIGDLLRAISIVTVPAQPTDHPSSAAA